MFRGYIERERIHDSRDSRSCRDPRGGGDPAHQSRQPYFKTKRREIGTFIRSHNIFDFDLTQGWIRRIQNAGSKVVEGFRLSRL